MKPSYCDDKKGRTCTAPPFSLLSHYVRDCPARSLSLTAWAILIELLRVADVRAADHHLDCGASRCQPRAGTRTG
jgi:hypothetical protein